MTIGAQKIAQRKREEKLRVAFPKGAKCQKCLEYGHWSYECKGKRKYVHRSSRSKVLNKNVEAMKKSEETVATTSGMGEISKKKAVESSGSSSSSSDSSSSDSSSSDSESGSSSSTSSSSSSSSSDSSSPKAKKKRRTKKSSSSSSSSSSD